MGEGGQGIGGRGGMISRFPLRPIRLILGASPGSASDFLARALAPELSRILGQPLAVELHPGDNGAKAASRVAASQPDGHTLFLTTLGIHAIAPNLVKRLPYDPLHDFASVSLVSRSPLVLAVHPSIEAESVAQLIDLARRLRGKLSYASSAIGGAPHLAAELFQAMAGIEMSHVRYERTQELYADLIAGRVALSFNNVMSMLPCLAAGKLRGLAVTGPERCQAAPQLPTVSESGLPGYEVTNWLGIVAPAGTSGESIAVLHNALAAALRTPAIAENLSRLGIEPLASTPEEFGAFADNELARWAPVVAKFGSEMRA